MNFLAKPILCTQGFCFLFCSVISPKEGRELWTLFLKIINDWFVVLGMCNAGNSGDSDYPYQWAGETVHIFLKKWSLLEYPACDQKSAVVDLKPALQFHPKERLYFNKQAKIQTKKKLPYQVYVCRNPHRFLCRSSLWQSFSFCLWCSLDWITLDESIACKISPKSSLQDFINSNMSDI